MNIRQLANELGLSTSTVSRALNGYADVNADTRQRVQETAKRLGYRPNAGARRLVRGKTDAVGIVYSAGVENLGNPQFLDMAGGLADRLQQDHLDLLLAVASDDQELDIYERLFRGGRVDAVVVPNTRLHDNRIDYLLSHGNPFLAYGRTAHCDNYPWFDFDNVLGSKLAVEHLRALGHTRFAYAHSPLELNFAFQRHHGFMSALKAADLQCPAPCVVGPAADRRSGYQAVTRLLALSERPTAIVVDNNLGGLGVIRGLVDAGLRLGHDVSVIVHGDIPSDSLPLGMNITTVTQPTAYASGVTMAEMVLQLLRDPGAVPQHHLKNPELVVGSTTGAAP